MSAQPPAREPVAERTGEVFDLGYQRYEGRREGRWRSRFALWRDGVRTTLGLGRSFTKKIAPFGLITLMWLPAVIVIVIIGFARTLAGEIEDVEFFTFADYFGLSLPFVSLFAAVVGPELLCPDRRQGVVTLYLVRPISVFDYLSMRWAALFSVLLLALWFPQLLIFAWNALSASDSLEWVQDNLAVLPETLFAASAIGALMTSIALAAASFTSRRPYAAVGALALVTVGSAIAAVAEFSLAGSAGDWAGLFNLLGMADTTSKWIMGVEVDRPLETWTYAAALVGVALAGAGALWLPYRGGRS